MTEIDYGALFGVDAGGNEQEPAAPASEEVETAGAQGGNEQEPAEPAEIEEPGAAESEDAGKPEQSPEERAKYAAARRKAEAERDAAVQKAREEAQAEARRFIDEAFKNSGMTNPYTQKPITTKEEYEAYRTRFEAEQKAGLMKKTGMSDEEFQKFVASLPEVREARAAKEAAEQAEKSAREQQAKLKVDEQLREISTLDPSIKELKDIAKMPTYQRFYELVKKGNTLTDAFKLANYEALAEKTAAASRQAAMNAARGKEHLNQTGSRGAGDVSVPAEVKEAYRAFNPTATEEEIRQHYNRYAKK